MKKCKEGHYYCHTDEKCKPIPKGYKAVGPAGMLRKETGYSKSESYDAGDFDTLKDKIGSAKKHRKTFKQFMDKD